MAKPNQKTTKRNNPESRQRGFVARTAETILRGIGSKKFLYATLIWFVFSAGFIAMTTSRAVAPDETAHLSRVKIYAEGGVTPFIHQTEATYYLGAVEQQPNYLFHYVMSMPYRFMPDAWSPNTKIVLLRLINMVFVLCGLVVFSRTVRRLTRSTLVQNLSVFMLSNTLMFVFLAGVLNYDNLFFLTTCVAFYYLVKLLQKFSLQDFLKLGIAVAIALLTKFTFVPLAVMFAIVLIVRYCRELRSVWQTSKTEIKEYRKPLIILAILFALVFGFFAERYVGNFIKYGSYRPKCENVLGHEKCLSSALYRRNLSFKDKEVTQKIPNEQFVAKWMLRTKETIFGIMGHHSLAQAPLIKYGSLVVIAVMLFAFVRTVSPRDSTMFYLIAIILMYVGALIIHNHNLFQRSQIFGMALQGRYIFPVLGMIYFVGNFFVERLMRKNRVAYASYALFVVVLFFASALPAYIYVTSSIWFMPSAEPFVHQIQLVLRAILP